MEMKVLYTKQQSGNIAFIIVMIAAIIAVTVFNSSILAALWIYVIGRPVMSTLIFWKQKHLYESSRKKSGLPHLDYEDIITNRASCEGYDHMLAKVKEAGMHSDFQIEDWHKENPWK